MSTDTGSQASTRYKRSEDVVYRQVGGEGVLVPVRQNVGNLDYVYTLSAVAATVWSLLDGTRGVGDLVDTICGEFDVPREVAAADIGELLADLHGAGLVTEAAS